MTTVSKPAIPCASPGIMGRMDTYGTEMFTAPELARSLKITTQSLDERLALAEARKWKPSRRGAVIPKPDAHTHSGRPLWRRSTLERAGLLDGASQDGE